MRRIFSVSVLALVAGLFLSTAAMAEVAANGSITGKVEKDSKAVAGAKVELKVVPREGAAKNKLEAPAKGDKPKDGIKPKDGGDKPKGPRPELKTVKDTVTQADGTFKFEDVAEGKYIIVVTSTEGRAKPTPVKVKAGETVDAGTITLMAKGGGKDVK